MQFFPPAKVNLGLNVVNRRPDGYHDLETVFYPVPLCDELDVKAMAADDSCPYDCDLLMDDGVLDCDPQQNLVVRAYRLLKEQCPTLPRVRVRLVKHIPSQAGMGGGSSDCAYMLVALNRMFHLGLSDERLMMLAARLGADCAFFITGRPAYAEGIGERLQPIDLDLSGRYIAIVKPPIAVPTRDAFARISPQRPPKNCREIINQPIGTWRDELVNDFELSVFALYPEIGEVKQKLYDMGAVYAAMSGSGSSVFGIFDAPVELAEAFPGMFTHVASF